MYTEWLGQIAWVSKIQGQSRVYEGKRNKSTHIITNISIYYFQSITRVDRYMCLELIFKNFSKLETYMNVVAVEEHQRSKSRNFKVNSLWRKASNMGHRTISNRKIEIKRPCLNEPSSTRYSDCYGHLQCKKMGFQWNKRGKNFRELSLHFGKKNCGIFALLILELYSKLFRRANILSKKDQKTKDLLFIILDKYNGQYHLKLSERSL